MKRLGNGSYFANMDIMNALASRFRIVLAAAVIGASMISETLGSIDK